MAKRGRPRKSGARNEKTGRLVGNVEPCQRVLERRALYAFVVPSKGPEGRGGTIDQDVCDGIGQLHALGLLDGYGIEAQELRDKGREWAAHYASLLRKSGFKTGSYERMDKARHEPQVTARDLRFDEVDERLRGRPRSALLQLLVDPIVGTYPDGRMDAPWVESHICEALLRMKKLPPAWMQPVRFPETWDRDWFEQAVEGLLVLASDAQRRMAA